MIALRAKRLAALAALAFWVAVPVLVTLAVPNAGWAQSTKKAVKERSVEGIVLDSAGNPVPSAIVQLKNARTQEIRSFIAQDKGNFFFNGLNPDVDYEVRAEANGASSQTKKLSSYDGRATFTVVLKLTK